MGRPKPDLTAAARIGLAKAYRDAKRDAAKETWDRLNAIAREEEEKRLIALAGGIYTEELLQKVLAQVEPASMRAAVEARIRPFTKIPVPIHE